MENTSTEECSDYQHLEEQRDLREDRNLAV